MTVDSSAIAATAGGGLLALAILLPAVGVLLSFLIGGRRAEWIALGLMPVELAVAVAIACLVWRSGEPLVYTLAGYAPPLGIALRADGFSGRDARDGGADRASRCAIRPRQFRHAGD